MAKNKFYSVKCRCGVLIRYQDRQYKAAEIWNRRSGGEVETMKIRDYCKKAGFEIVGKLSLMGKWDLTSRYYMDEGGNIFVVDTVIGGIRIIPKGKRTG